MNHSSYSTITSMQETPHLTMAIPRCLRDPSSPNHSTVAALRVSGNYEGALAALAAVPRTYEYYYLSGVIKYEWSKTFPTLQTTRTVVSYGCMCFCKDVKVVPADDIDATKASKAKLLDEAHQDLTLAYYVASELPGTDPRVQSDIGLAVAVVLKDLNQDAGVRAYISRAVELNADNMEARKAFEVHKKQIHTVNVQTHTKVSASATATAQANASASASITR